jgi:hypothetical protein
MCAVRAFRSFEKAHHERLFETDDLEQARERRKELLYRCVVWRLFFSFRVSGALQRRGSSGGSRAGMADVARVVGVECDGDAAKSGARSCRFVGKLFFEPETESARTEDAAALRGLLAQADQNKQAYVEAVGPKGIGYSVLIDTVLAHKAGVVEVDVGPGTGMDDLVATVHRRIGGYRVLGKSDGDAKRVLFLFKVFGSRPTVIFRVRERSAGEDYRSKASSGRPRHSCHYRCVTKLCTARGHGHRASITFGNGGNVARGHDARAQV